MSKPTLPPSLTLPRAWSDVEIARDVADHMEEACRELDRRLPGPEYDRLRKMLEETRVKALEIVEEEQNSPPTTPPG